MLLRSDTSKSLSVAAIASQGSGLRRLPRAPSQAKSALGTRRPHPDCEVRWGAASREVSAETREPWPGSSSTIPENAASIPDFHAHCAVTGHSQAWGTLRPGLEHLDQ